ncbi:MAG: hypothetical protein CM15mV81_050 [uncultured marine virus]|nr:MAG: hypothetical protein CM15mV81_050 [uncultured marine virus]
MFGTTGVTVTGTAGSSGAKVSFEFQQTHQVNGTTACSGK